jgi:hypothetical protein
MNIDNINRIIERFREDNGSHFKMAGYAEFLPGAPIEEHEDPKTPRRYIECNTAFCIAGQANLFRLADEGCDVKDLAGQDFRDQFEDEYAAGDWLGITGHGLSHRLFYMKGVNWDDEYDKRRAFDALPDQTRRAAGIRVLEILRDEKVVDWERAITEAKAQSEPGIY